MDYTEKCKTCAKSGHLINQGIYFACFDDECHYEPLPKTKDYTANTFATPVLGDEEREIKPPIEVNLIEEETPE